MSDFQITRWKTFRLMVWPALSSTAIAVGVLWLLSHVTTVGLFLSFLGGFWAGCRTTGDAIKAGVWEMIKAERAGRP